MQSVQIRLNPDMHCSYRNLPQRTARTREPLAYLIGCNGYRSSWQLLDSYALFPIYRLLGSMVTNECSLRLLRLPSFCQDLRYC